MLLILLEECIYWLYMKAYVCYCLCLSLFDMALSQCLQWNFMLGTVLLPSLLLLYVGSYGLGNNVLNEVMVSFLIITHLSSFLVVLPDVVVIRVTWVSIWMLCPCVCHAVCDCKMAGLLIGVHFTMPFPFVSISLGNLYLHSSMKWSISLQNLSFSICYFCFFLYLFL